MHDVGERIVAPATSALRAALGAWGVLVTPWILAYGCLVAEDWSGSASLDWSFFAVLLLGLPVAVVVASIMLCAVAVHLVRQARGQWPNQARRAWTASVLAAFALATLVWMTQSAFDLWEASKSWGG